MGTKVKVLFDDTKYSEFKEGQIGEVDGYIRGADDKPRAIVIIENKFVMIPLYGIEKQIEDVGYSNRNRSNFSTFSAKTDWDKIEQAMKSVEPREIWVNEWKGYNNEPVLGKAYLTLKEASDNKVIEHIRTIKFREVTNE